MARRSDRIVLALDLGTNTGWALVGVGKRGARRQIASGTASFRPEEGKFRTTLFIDFLEKLVEKYGRPDLVAYEKVYRHLGTYACHVYGALEGVVEMFVDEYRCGLQPVTVQAVKKRATGKGNANKELVLEAARRQLNPDITTHDEADAYWVAEVAIGEVYETTRHAEDD